MRDYLSKTWVKAGLVLLALPTALAEASPIGDEIATAGLAASLDESAANPENSQAVSDGLFSISGF